MEVRSIFLRILKSLVLKAKLLYKFHASAVKLIGYCIAQKKWTWSNLPFLLTPLIMTFFLFLASGLLTLTSPNLAKKKTSIKRRFGAMQLI